MSTCQTSIYSCSLAPLRIGHPDQADQLSQYQSHNYAPQMEDGRVNIGVNRTNGQGKMHKASAVDQCRASIYIPILDSRQDFWSSRPLDK